MSDKPMNKHSETDWERIDAMADDEIDTSDIPALTDTFFKRAKIRMPKRPLTIQVDADVLDWFTAQGEDYERRINAALRIYAEAHKAAWYSPYALGLLLLPQISSCQHCPDCRRAGKTASQASAA